MSDGKKPPMSPINVSLNGVVHLNAPEAEWIMNATGMAVAQMKAAKDAGKVLLAQQAEFDAQYRGLAMLHQKAQKAFTELLPEYQSKVEEEGG